MSALKGLVTEGSHLLLMRLFALRKKVPENMKFISLDKGLAVKHSFFVSYSMTDCDRRPPFTVLITVCTVF